MINKNLMILVFLFFIELNTILNNFYFLTDTQIMRFKKIKAHVFSKKKIDEKLTYYQDYLDF